MEYSRKIARVGNANEKERLIYKRRKLRKGLRSLRINGKMSGGRGKLMKAAEQKYDCKKMYRILRDIGVKDVNKEVMIEEFFTPNEYKAHFEKVSKDWFERTVEEIDKLTHNIPKIEDEEYPKKLI